MHVYLSIVKYCHLKTGDPIICRVANSQSRCGHDVLKRCMMGKLLYI